MGDDVKLQVLKALESPKYKWRTLDGVSAEASLPKGVVLDAIRDLSRKGVVVRSSAPSENGEALFTTRNHYRATASFSERLFAVLRNRGA